jgi:hypothetical protein
MEDGMSFEEKSTWAATVISIGGFVAYVSALLTRANGSDISHVPFVDLLLIVGIGIPIAVTIVVSILIAVIWHRTGRSKDQRDTEIDRHGEYVGGVVLAVLMIAPFGLALADIDTFWIAHAMYLAFIIAALIGAIVKVVVYRRGF